MKISKKLLIILMILDFCILVSLTGCTDEYENNTLDNTLDSSLYDDTSDLDSIDESISDSSATWTELLNEYSSEENTLVETNTAVSNVEESKSNIQENATVTTASGTYTGDIIDGMRHDTDGKFTFTNGYVYEGSFVHNQIDGQGKLTMTGIGTYEGNFSNGKRSGQGTMKFSNGDSYTGNWENDMMSGTGYYTFSNGDKYEGTLTNNKMEGYGTYTVKSTGKQYYGLWSDNSYKG